MKNLYPVPTFIVACLLFSAAENSAGKTCFNENRTSRNSLNAGKECSNNIRQPYHFDDRPFLVLPPYLKY